MKNVVQVLLKIEPEQKARLRALQQAFADVCNAIAPLAAQTRCWNRVALHHMTYRSLRERFPQLGSQMVCNAIYSVSRTCRRVYQAPASPFNVARWGDRKLPVVRFTPDAPVYFDRHTLSLRNGELSLFTLDGRMRFGIGLPPEVEERFKREKLQEIALSSNRDEFRLTFAFEQPDDAQAGGAQPVRAGRAARPAASAALPEYVNVLSEAEASPTGNPA